MTYTKGKLKIVNVGDFEYSLQTEYGLVLGLFKFSGTKKSAEELAARIVQCVNGFDEVVGAIEGFGVWYNTLAHLNPDSFIKLKEILPNDIINRFNKALKNAGRQDT